MPADQTKIRIRVAVLLRKGNQVLLVRHYKNDMKYWLLPGGGLEFGETIENCARRELMEETNLEIEVGDFLFMNESIPPDHHRHVVNLYYEGRILGGELKLGDDKALYEVGFVDIDQIPSLTFFPNVKAELMQYLAADNSIERRSLGNRWE
jgi:ADP-ribose pyrophosphatase YjhB (NUDIX family)